MGALNFFCEFWSGGRWWDGMAYYYYWHCTTGKVVSFRDFSPYTLTFYMQIQSTSFTLGKYTESVTHLVSWVKVDKVFMYASFSSPYKKSNSVVLWSGVVIRRKRRLVAPTNSLIKACRILCFLQNGDAFKSFSSLWKFDKLTSFSTAACLTQI